MAENKSIFEHDFYAQFLNGAPIPGEEKIPFDLLQAIAVLIGRYMEAYVDPISCKGVAALVVLGMERDAALSAHEAALPHAPETSVCLEHIQKTKYEIQVAEGLPGGS